MSIDVNEKYGPFFDQIKGCLIMINTSRCFAGFLHGDNKLSSFMNFINIDIDTGLIIQLFEDLNIIEKK